MQNKELNETNNKNNGKKIKDNIDKLTNIILKNEIITDHKLLNDIIKLENSTLKFLENEYNNIFEKEKEYNLEEIYEYMFNIENNNIINSNKFLFELKKIFKNKNNINFYQNFYFIKDNFVILKKVKNILKNKELTNEEYEILNHILKEIYIEIDKIFEIIIKKQRLNKKIFNKIKNEDIIKKYFIKNNLNNKYNNNINVNFNNINPSIQR